MRVMIVGKETEALAKLARGCGLDVRGQCDARDGVPLPDGVDAIVCHGGDGTLLGAERAFPTVPKLALRLDHECQKCERHSTATMLTDLAAGRIEATRIIKVQARIDATRLVGINDVIVHTVKPFSAVRYKVWIGDELYSEEIVGDGLVAATPFGSSAYYRSITHSVIRAGIGLAFNNTTEPIDHIVLRDDEAVRVVITRGPAIAVADNGPEVVELTDGDEVAINKADETANVLGLDTLLCNHCRRLDGRRWSRHGGLLTL